MKKVLLGMGSVIRRDDGVGIYVVEEAKGRLQDWILINGETVPENYTSYLKRESPDLLVIVDAADMDLPSGSIRRIGATSIDELFLTTHTMSIGFMIAYLRPYIEHIIMIGIQPEDTSIGEGISDAVKQAAFRLIEIMEDGMDAITRIPQV